MTNGGLWQTGDVLSKERLNQKTVYVGSTAPTETYAGQIWFDTSSNVWKVRNSNNSSWIPFYNLPSLQIGGTEVITSGRVLQNITSIAQTILPSLDNAYDLGSSSYFWSDAYIKNRLYIGAIDTSLYRSTTDVLKTDDNFDALSLRIGGTQVITSGRVLQNIASISQTLLPTSNNSYDLGSTSYKWRDLLLSRDLYLDGVLHNPFIDAYASDYGLVLYLPFEEGTGSTVYDESPNGYEGTIYGATWTGGKYGKALSFDGVDDYVDLGNILNFGSSDSFTIALWFKPPDTDTAYFRSLVTKIQSSDYPGYRLYWAPQDMRIYFETISSGTYASIWCTLPDRNWHFIVGVRDKASNVVRLFLDGSLKTTGSDPTGDLSNSQNLYIASGGGIDKGKGIIDEVRIYNRALSTEEIRALYLAGKGRHSRSIVVSDKFRILNSSLAEILRTTSSGQLQLPIQGSSAGLLIGGDTNLYRSAADVLKTDDSFDTVALRISGSEVIDSSRILKNISAVNQNILPLNTQTNDLGSPSNCWRYLYSWLPLSYLTSGSTILYRDDTQVVASNTSWEKKKEVYLSWIVPETADLNIYWEMYAARNPETSEQDVVYARIYRNGQAYGSTFSRATYTWGSYNQTLSFNKGDYVQLYAYCVEGIGYGIRNFRIRATLNNQVVEGLGRIATRTDEYPGFVFGTPSGTFDVNLYRADTDVLKTDDNVDAYSLRIGGTEVISSSRVLRNVTADASIITSGTFAEGRIPHTWYNPFTLYNYLLCTSFLQLVTQYYPTDIIFSTYYANDIYDRFRIDGTGKLYWGSGSSSVLDTNLYRASADVLKTDDNFDALSLRIGGTQVISSGRSLTGLASIGQTLTPSVDGTYDLGSASYRFRYIYPTSIYTGNSASAGVSFQTHDGSAYQTAATLVGGYFSISRAASITPDADNTRDLGSSTSKWRDLYIAGQIKGDGLGKALVNTPALYWFENTWPTGALYTTISGGSITWYPALVSLNTGATAGNYVIAYKAIPSFGTATWSKPRYFKTYVYFSSNTNQIIHIVAGYASATSSTNTNPHVGFKIINNTLYATNGDGSNEAATSVGTISASSYKTLAFEFTPSRCVYYVDNTQVATHLTYLPLGTSYASYFFYITVYTSAAENKNVNVYEVRTFQGE